MHCGGFGDGLLERICKKKKKRKNTILPTCNMSHLSNSMSPLLHKDKLWRINELNSNIKIRGGKMFSDKSCHKNASSRP